MKTNRIKKALQEKGLTQVWLTGQLEKSFKMVNAYACNRHQPTMDVLYKIADILDMEVADLLVMKMDFKK